MIDPMPKPKRDALDQIEQDDHKTIVVLTRIASGLAIGVILGAGWLLGSAFPLF